MNEKEKIALDYLFQLKYKNYETTYRQEWCSHSTYIF